MFHLEGWGASDGATVAGTTPIPVQISSVILIIELVAQI